MNLNVMIICVALTWVVWFYKGVFFQGPTVGVIVLFFRMGHPGKTLNLEEDVFLGWYTGCASLLMVWVKLGQLGCKSDFLLLEGSGRTGATVGKTQG